MRDTVPALFRSFCVAALFAGIVGAGCGDTKLFDEEEGENGSTTTLQGATTTTLSTTTTTLFPFPFPYSPRTPRVLPPVSR